MKVGSTENGEFHIITTRTIREAEMLLLRRRLLRRPERSTHSKKKKAGTDICKEMLEGTRACKGKEIIPAKIRKPFARKPKNYCICLHNNRVINY